MKEKFKIWLKAALNRACRTMGQSAIAMMGSAVVLQDVNWLMLLSSTALTGILSMATSAAGLPEINEKHCKKCWAAAAAERAIKTTRSGGRLSAFLSIYKEVTKDEYKN